MVSVWLDRRNDTREVLGSLSTDGGATWSEASKQPAFAADDRLQRTLKNVFYLTPSHEPSVWYAGGCSPQSLFRSDDDGVTWSPVSGWNDHPQWETWCEYPEEQTPDGAMTGGDDYELLFTAADEARVREAFAGLRAPIVIGRVVEGSEVTGVPEGGWRHEW